MNLARITEPATACILEVGDAYMGTIRSAQGLYIETPECSTHHQVVHSIRLLSHQLALRTDLSDRIRKPR